MAASYDSINKVVYCIVLLVLMFGCATTQATTKESSEAVVNSVTAGDEAAVKPTEAAEVEFAATEESPAGEEAAFELLEGGMVVTGNIWWKYRFGDYVVKAVGRETSKFDRKSDVTTLKRIYEVSAPTGATAKIKRERRNFWGIEYPDASLGDVVLDALVENAWGWSLIDDDPDPILLKYDVSSTITLGDAPGETWQLELERLPMPEGGRLGSQFEWGYGTLTNGVRTLELVLHGASPGEEECLKISRKKKWYQPLPCRDWIIEIKEDGELLAWNGNRGCSQNNNYHAHEYCFRVGLDVDTKLLLLAMFAAMIA